MYTWLYCISGVHSLSQLIANTSNIETLYLQSHMPYKPACLTAGLYRKAAMLIDNTPQLV